MPSALDFFTICLPTGCINITTGFIDYRESIARPVFKPIPSWWTFGVLLFTIHTRKNQTTQTTTKKTLTKTAQSSNRQLFWPLKPLVWWRSNGKFGIRFKSMVLMCVPVQGRTSHIHKSYPPATSPAGSNTSNWQGINWPATWPIYTRTRTHAHTQTSIVHEGNKMQKEWLPQCVMTHGEEEEIWELVNFMILATKYVYSKGDRLEGKWRWSSSSTASTVPSLPWVFFLLPEERLALLPPINNHTIVVSRKEKGNTQDLIYTLNTTVHSMGLCECSCRCEVGQRIRSSKHPMKDLGFVLKFPR